MTEEGFQLQKGNILCELGLYHSAIYALKKANVDLDTYYVNGSIGWCYIQLEVFDKALDYYRKAQQHDESPEILLGLAVSELHAGCIEASKAYYERLKPFKELDGMAVSLSQLEVEYSNREGCDRA